MNFGTRGCMYCEGECNKECLSQEEPKQETSNEAKKRAKNYMKLKDALNNKQETPEEAADRANGYNVYAKETKAPIFKEGFTTGAKWQQEQNKNKYSEEDMKQFAWECVANFLSNSVNQVEMALVEVIIDRNSKQFEQFKKK
jgi:hypothetical protein